MTSLPPCPIPSNPSPQLRTVLAWVSGFNAWDADLIAAQLSAERYEHHILPASLKQPVTKGKEAYVEYLRGMVPMFREFKVTIHEIIESPGKVILHASSRAISATSHPYANEYILVLHLDSDAVINASVTASTPSPKVISVKEFVDSHYALAFFPAERARIASGRERDALESGSVSEKLGP